jgi:hypothetical protein
MVKDSSSSSLIYYKSEVSQNSKTKEKNSCVIYFLGVFFFTLGAISATQHPLLGIGLCQWSLRRSVLRFPHPAASFDLHQICSIPEPELKTNPGFTRHCPARFFAIYDLRPKLIINLNPFLHIRHRNFNLNLCSSVPIMYPHCESWLNYIWMQIESRYKNWHWHRINFY